ncbi:MAG TPA: sulfite exporter TauE/SafE family protein [Blastocatellia bacterium]|jgi:hypothetical protein|nr:sulfite exporter TauE/SafE family protein [Blastocatellia bacterium]
MTVGILLMAGGLAALVKGTLGFGFPPVATPLVAGIVGAKTAVTVLAIPSLVLNLTQVWIGRSSIGAWRSVVPLMSSIILGSFCGGYLLTVLPAHLAGALVGMCVMGYVTLAMLKVRLELAQHLVRPAGAVLGLVAGLLGGATGIHGPLLVLYLSMLRLEKETFAGLLSLVLLIAQVPQVMAYAVFGLFNSESLLWSAAMLPGVAVGFYCGSILRSRISQRTFAVVVRCALLVVGIRLLFEAIWP